MNEIEKTCEIVERMQKIFIKSEEIAASILRILDQMENIELIMEEEKNV